jgi:hypothetical protein
MFNIMNNVAEGWQAAGKCQYDGPTLKALYKLRRKAGYWEAEHWQLEGRT